MVKKIKHILINVALTCGFLSAVACSSAGTEVGNPSSRRNISGALVASSAQPALVNSLAFAVSNSCPVGNGDVTVILRDPSGDTVTVDVNADGSFAAQIDQDQVYEILFEQNGTECGHLTNVASDLQGGQRVTLGEGTANIVLGSLDDRGDGIIATSSDPGQYCDNDGDGITDDLDDDDNGDGIIDSDSDFDGYIDWFDTDDDGDGVPDATDDSTLAADGPCDIAFVYPTTSSGLALDSNGQAEILAFVNSDISSVSVQEIAVTNVESQQDSAVFSETDLITEGDIFSLQVSLAFDTEYALTIPVGAVQCTDGHTNQNAVSVDFFTLEQE
jgi:hypothetical protein